MQENARSLEPAVIMESRACNTSRLTENKRDICPDTNTDTAIMAFSAIL